MKFLEKNFEIAVFDKKVPGFVSASLGFLIGGCWVPHFSCRQVCFLFAFYFLKPFLLFYSIYAQLEAKKPFNVAYVIHYQPFFKS